MPRTRNQSTTDVVFREPGPPKSQYGGAWLPTLTALLRHKGQWAMVKEFDNPELAGSAQSNLAGRRVRIPEPEHDWGFAARGCELFAIYRGPFHAKRVNPRRKR